MAWLWPNDDEMNNNPKKTSTCPAAVVKSRVAGSMLMTMMDCTANDDLMRVQRKHGNLTFHKK